MNAQQLKNAILQEAITGRLVPQDPNDEPASVLLDRIRKEKAKLVKEGKLKKKDLEEKPISKEEIPFEIPESWEWCRLISLSRIIHYGYTASAAPTGNAKLLRITDIQDDKVNWQTVPFCTIKEKELDNYQLHNRDILIARTGGTVGKTYIVRELNDVSVFASYLIRAIPLGNVYEEYIKLFMGSPYYWSQLIDATSGTGQPNVNGQSLSNLIVPLPPLAEQHRIVAKIEELLPKVEEYGKAQEALDKLNAELPERLKKSILQEAITGKLVPQDPNDEPASVLLDRIRKEKAKLVKEGKLKKKDLIETPISKDEIPFEIPESWEWVRLGTITTVLGGKRIPAGRKLTQDNTGHIYIRVSDMKEETVSIDNLLYVPKDIFPSISRYIINKDDVYITVAGTIGKIGKIPSELDGANLTENADRLVFSNICQDWLIKSLQSAVIQSQIAEVTTKVGQPKLAILRIQNLIIPLPPLAEQHRIVAKIEELLSKIDKLKTK